MENIILIAAGALALIFGLVWYTSIQKTRKKDQDFEKRESAKETLDEVNF